MSVKTESVYTGEFLVSEGNNTISREQVPFAVNQRLQKMNANHEVTLEFLRMGALKGEILDGDGSTILYNLFD